MSPEPFDSHAKALPAKRSEKGNGDENENEPVGINLVPRALSTFQNRGPGEYSGRG